MKKSRKTLYLADFVIDLLDKEGALYDGPGVVAAAAIYQFSNLTQKGKVDSMNAFRNAEINLAYADEDKAIAKSVVESALAAEEAHGKNKSGNSSKSA